MLRSSVIVTIISVVTYLVSFVNQILIAKLFGASSNLDAYLVAISFPFLLMTITGSGFSIALVPILVQKSHQINFARFSGLLLIVVSIASIVLSGVGYVLSPFIIHMMAPTYSGPLALKTIAMMRISWLIYGCSMIVNYFVACHNAAKRFFVAAGIAVLPYLGMIVFSLLWADQIGAKTLVWGMLAGTLAAMPLLWIDIRKELRLDYGCFSLWTECLRAFRRMPLIFLTMLGLSLYATIDVIWATRLGASNLSYLSYSQRILIALGNVIVLGPMTVILPHLSEENAIGRYKEFRAQTLRALRMVVVFLSFVGLFVSILARPLIRLIFERGAFDRATTLQVVAIIPGMFIGVFAMVATVLLYRAYYAKGDIAGTASISMVGALIYFSLSGLLSKIGGLQGIVVAYAATWWMLLIWSLLRLWRNNLAELISFDNLRFLLQLIFALGLSGGFVWASAALFIHPVIEASASLLCLRLVLVVGMGSIFFIIAASLGLKMKEVIIVLELLPLVGMKHRRAITKS